MSQKGLSAAYYSFKMYNLINANIPPLFRTNIMIKPILSITGLLAICLIATVSHAAKPIIHKSTEPGLD